MNSMIKSAAGIGKIAESIAQSMPGIKTPRNILISIL